MGDKRYSKIYDVRWKKVFKTEGENLREAEIPGDSALGEIIFRRTKKKSKIKILLKGVAFMLIASISGAVSTIYIIESKYDRNFRTNGYNDLISGYTRIDNVNDNPTKNSITYVADIVSPAVVGISNNADNFFGRAINQSTGSGIIIDASGYILTNYNVIGSAEQVSVKLSSGSSKPISAKVVGYDKTYDLALLKIDIEGLPYVRLGDSSKVKIGDIAIAIGNPLGEEFSGFVTAGIISATNRRIEIVDPLSKEQTVYKVFQTDAGINPGNSGGPLCNEFGEVIGINCFKAGTEVSTEGMSFAITINEAKKVIEAIKNYGNVERPQLGIYGKTVDENILNLKGVYVLQVYSGYGAVEAGIRPMDVITEVDGRKIEKLEELNEVIENHKIEDVIRCKVYRDGKELELKLTLKKKK